MIHGTFVPYAPSSPARDRGCITGAGFQGKFLAA
jgi:hypothetical protein